MTKSLIAGYGEIGKAVHETIGEADVVDTILKLKPTKQQPVDILHVCFPYSRDFSNFIAAYKNLYEPKHIVIYSTVPIGTIKKIPTAIHSPVEGKHPKLAKSFRCFPRWIGANTKKEAQFFNDYFTDLGLTTKIIMNSNHTEALKLLSTTEYGVNIAFADYKAWIAKDIKMDFELTKDWNRDYNQLYRELGMDRSFQKFVLDAPEGKIGGHCIKENSILLSEQYPDDVLDLINRMEKP